MIPIRNAILRALSMDEQKAKLFRTKTKERKIVQMKYEVFLILAQKGYKKEEIAEYANCSRATVHHGIQRCLGNKTLKRDRIISESVIEKLTLNGACKSKGSLFHELVKEGYGRMIIARHFGIKYNRVKNHLSYHRKSLSTKELEETKKKIIRFR